MDNVTQFFLSSDQSIVHNDVVLAGSPFRTGMNYVFTISPQSKFWRFGLRFSEKENIEFFHPTSRYQAPEFEKYVDLHIGVGNWNNIQWSDPNQIELKNYNANTKFGEIDFKTDGYEPLATVTWIVSFEYYSNLVTTRLVVDGKDLVVRNFSFEPGFAFFKVFAWADGVPFSLRCDLEVTRPPQLEEVRTTPSAIKAGNLLIYHDTVPEVLQKIQTDFLVFPLNESDQASSSGSLNTTKELVPTFQMLGRSLVNETKFRRHNYDTTILAGSVIRNGAYSDGNLEVLLKNFKSRFQSAQQGKMINIVMPLFTSTRIGISMDYFMRALDRVFNERFENFTIHVIASTLSDVLTADNVLIGKTIDATGVQYSLAVLQLEKYLQTKLVPDHYQIDARFQIIDVLLYNYNGNLLKIAELAPELKRLRLIKCDNIDLPALSRFKKLRDLTIGSTSLKNLEFLQHISLLTELEIEGGELSSLSGIETQTGIVRLALPGNAITSISELSFLSRLTFLDLSRNLITDVNPIFKLKFLTHLDLSLNPIVQFKGVGALRKLTFLSIANTLIEDASEIAKLRQLEKIYLHEIPWLKHIGIVLKDLRQDQIISLNNYFSRKNNKNKKPFTSPVKVLFLGNHGSGKSSMVEYLQTGTIPAKMNSTHIIRVEPYPKSAASIPKAVFFDFGGQDYYHGIYRAFLSGRAIYLMLWDANHNRNEQRKDIHGFTTQDYTVSYWMSHRTYLINEKFGGAECPTLLIQSHYDEGGKQNAELVSKSNLQIRNEFALSFDSTKAKSVTVYQAGLIYLKESLDDLITGFAKTEDQPKWYIDFITYIINQIGKNDHKSVSLQEIEKKYRRTGINALRFLKDDLSQLHEQGLILYYPEISEDCAWLNPTALVQFIHDNILTMKIIREGEIAKKDVAHFDQNIIKLLIEQKVLFENNDKPNYIVPNFLPLVSETQDQFDMMTFGLDESTFSLKFVEFMPFGLINQLICFFGTKGDLKKYWRDQLLFTLEKHTKVLIRIDLSRLEIKVLTQHHKDVDARQRKLISAYLFYTIIGTYWDLKLFDFENFIQYRAGNMEKTRSSLDPLQELKLNHANLIYQNDACRPDDLYISLDDLHYARYCTLAAIVDQPIISAVKFSSEDQILPETYPLQVYHFQPFMSKELRRPKKCVISYSKLDFEHVLDFKKHIDPLYKAHLIESPWNCTELFAGITWDDEIQKKFDEADIIFYLISGNLLTTSYVLDHEIKKGIDRYDNAPGSVKLVPIVLSYYDWMKTGDQYDLGRFTGLPYMLRPIDTFENRDMVWYTVSKAIRRMIESDLDPFADAQAWGKEIEQLYLQMIGDKKKTL